MRILLNIGKPYIILYFVYSIRFNISKYVHKISWSFLFSISKSFFLNFDFYYVCSFKRCYLTELNCIVA